MKILIIDDCKEDRELIIKYLKNKEQKYPLYADECDCLGIGLNKIKNNNYDVILLDLALPESDGIQTIITIQNALEESNKDTPIIILTGLEDYKIGKEAFAMGIKDFLIKGEFGSQDIKRSLNFATYKLVSV